MSIRTLVITKLPLPPVGGEHLRSWQNINALSHLGPVHVFSVFRYDYDTQPANGIVATWHSYNVNKQPFPLNRLEPLLWWFQTKGLWDYWPYRHSARRQLESLLEQIKPDLVVIEELWLYPYFSSIKQCPVIFDHHNVEAPLFEATKCRDQGLRGWLRSLIHLPQIKADEKRFLNRADQTWVCSQRDSQQLQQLYNRGRVHIVPNAIDTGSYDSVRTNLRTNQSHYSPELILHGRYVLYLGNFGYIPNAEAAQQLIEQVYPLLKQDWPDCRLLLVGREPTPLMLAAAQQDSHITVTGQVVDVKPYLSASTVMVVPLKKGSGTRFKILEAFAAGRPVVSSAKGAEGLNVKDGKHLLIRERPIEMAQAISWLWNNPERSNTIMAAAYALVQRDYSWKAVSQDIRHALSKLFPEL